jgi:two-component system, response regulator
MIEKTVLLVEDNDNDVFLTRRALNKLNIPYKLEVAQDGVEALARLFPETAQVQNANIILPDLLLLDLKLPRVDGLQVLRKIRSNDLTRHLEVIIWTSSSEETDIAAAHQLGVTSYNVKPTNAKEFSDLIQTLVKGYLFSAFR